MVKASPRRSSGPTACCTADASRSRTGRQRSGSTDGSNSFVPSRRPRRDQRQYCLPCRHGGAPQRAAARDYRDREPARKRRKAERGQGETSQQTRGQTTMNAPARRQADGLSHSALKRKAILRGFGCSGWFGSGFALTQIRRVVPASLRAGR